jgi:hypothetical protein
MARRSPTDPAGPAGIPGEPPDQPTARAELQIILLPPDDDGHAGDQGPPDIIARSLRFPARAPRGRLHAKFVIPSRNAGEMLWALTMISTLAITVPSGVSYVMIALILAVELAGFVIGAVSARRHRRQSRNRR